MVEEASHASPRLGRDVASRPRGRGRPTAPWPGAVRPRCDMPADAVSPPGIHSGWWAAP